MKKTSKVRFGFLGCGRVSERHIEVFRDEIKDACVNVVCDEIPEKANNSALKLGARAVYNMQELLSSQDVDVVCIMTESGKHATHTRQALENGKHVVVEKPAALIPNEIHALEELARQKGLMYAVIFQNRFNPSMRMLKSAVERGRFGKMVLGTIRLRWCRYQDYYEDGWHGTWAMDGGVIGQQALHHLDALQWICGPVSEAVATEANALNRLEAEDTLVSTVKFANGALGVIEATTAARPDDFEASISVVGERGTVVIDGIALNHIRTWQFMDATPIDLEIPKRYSQDVPTGYGLSHGPLMQEIVNRLIAGRLDPPISGTDASGAIQLAHALYMSVEVGEWVKVSEHTLSSRWGRNSGNSTLKSAYPHMARIGK